MSRKKINIYKSSKDDLYLIGSLGPSKEFIHGFLLNGKNQFQFLDAPIKKWKLLREEVKFNFKSTEITEKKEFIGSIPELKLLYLKPKNKGLGFKIDLIKGSTSLITVQQIKDLNNKTHINWEVTLSSEKRSKKLLKKKDKKLFNPSSEMTWIPLA
ncbi:MAG: hypothetical protein SLAVMIC_00949 [uncultured marine phage]|uniref:Uncharacterized protein n=1 Tax=uncultured marine phage TaxID=707152 RepID=A0A8D9CAX8_9VIRU|nr:MAG: hypothetical protein SLAVMIC_00949 [uncultured marine phage]